MNLKVVASVLLLILFRTSKLVYKFHIISILSLNNHRLAVMFREHKKNLIPSQKSFVNLSSIFLKLKPHVNKVALTSFPSQFFQAITY